MFESVIKFFKNLGKKENTKESSDTAKERLHLVLMQDRANVSADFLELMKQEIIEVIKKYIEVDEKAIDVRLTNKANEDGTVGAPALYANIPITTIKNEVRKVNEIQEKDGQAKITEKEKIKKVVEDSDKIEKKKASNKEVDKKEVKTEKKEEKLKEEPKKEKKAKTVEKENPEKKAKHVKEEVETIKEPVKKK